MAETRDRPQPHQLQVHSQSRYDKSSLLPQRGPTAAQILAVVTLLPVGASLLGLAGIILVGTLIGLAVATPLFVIFSPVLVPAAILLAGAVTGILTSGAFGLTGLSSLSWVLNSFRQVTGRQPLDYAKRRMQETAWTVGEKTKQAGETIKAKAGPEEGAGGGRT
ncbi:oleosin H1-like [Andrographis paniculata]|uniref:oleosin H1-like n=1 Tax=Andrographis paniculata TaxID=175694 RepID=UPI0021E85C43|nr:oleosin H1-like [Andrographis paniculata]